MKTHSGLPRCTGLVPLSSLCCFSHQIRLVLAVLFAVFAGAAANVCAQTISNCVTIVCPPQFVTNYTCDEVFAPMAYPLIVSNHCANVQVQVICDPAPGTPLGVGAHPIHCSVTANGQVARVCDFTLVVVRDTTPPLIQCPSNMVVSACPGPAGCAAVVTYPLPSASDNSGSVSVTCVPASGSAFPCGTTTVTCTAEDRCNLKTSCTFDVKVLENGEPPKIECPADITVDTCSNRARVTFSATVTPAGTSVVCLPPSGSAFPIGSSGVTCIASNGCGSADCSFKVTVRSQPAVTIQCPTNIVVTAPCGSNCVPVSYPLPLVSNGILIGCTPPSGSCFPVGVTTVTCRATNSCGITECKFDVRVLSANGQTPPAIKCPSNIVVTLPCGSNCVPVFYPPPLVTNGFLAGCTPPSGTCLPAGIHLVNCFATNNCASAECSFTIQVIGGTAPPSIQCPSNIVVTAPCNTNCVPTSYPLPLVSNGVLAGCAPPPGSCFPIGITTVTCRATNSCGQSAICQFDIRVLEAQGQPPAIQCPTNISVTAPCGSNCVPAFYPSPFVSNGSLQGCTPPSGSCFPIGITTVTCRATNACSVATCRFDVRVFQAQQGPSIRCPSNLVVQLPCNSNCVPVFYPTPTVTNGVLVNCNPPPGTCLPAGIHLITCFATNNCGSAACEFTIQVIGGTTGQPPSIQCPSNIVVTAPCNSNCVPVFYPLPLVSNGMLAGCTPPRGTCFPIGITTVTCRATNTCGQSATCEFEVRVNTGQDLPPTIQCPTTNYIVTVPCGSNCVPAFYPFPVVGNGTLAGCTPPRGTCLPVGIHPIVCTATNRCGLSASCTFTVEVREGQNQPPILRCPTNTIIVPLPCGSNCAPIFYPAPFVTNGVLIGCNPPQGTCLPAGIYDVNCRASNACGFAECDFLLRVIESTGQPPVLQCPTNPVVVTVPCGSNCVPVAYPLPLVSNGVLTGCTPPLGTCLPAGVYVVTCTATNSCAETRCSFTLEVRPGQGAPVIQCPTNSLIFRMPCHSNCVPVTYPLPTVNNGVLVGCTPPPGTCLPIGDYVVTCRATNNCGEAKCEFVVRVLPTDPVPPIIQCPTNIFVTVPCGSNCVPVFYPAPVVNNGVLLGCSPPSGSCFPLGITTVNCRATNSCGLVAECKFDVRVAQGEGQAPTLRCPTNFTVALPCGSNCAPVFYPLPIITNGVLIGCNPAPGTCLPAGNHLITCFASNNCGSASCEFVVTVRGETAPPTIRCASNIVVTLPCNSNCVPVFYPAPFVTNGVLVGCTPASGTCLPAGIYNVVCKATNNCGQSASCEFQVRVIQSPGGAPIIQCASNVVVTAPCGSNCVPVFYPLPFVTNGALQSCTPPPGTCFPVGTNLVMCRATNNCGSSICQFIVRVIPSPGEAPAIKCPTNFVVATIPCGSNCVPIFYPLPAVTNGVLVGCTPPPGTCLPAGNYPVICTASNNCGVAQCDFVVQVVGGQGHAPIINCPSNITVETCSPNCQPVNYPLPTVFNGALAGCTPPPGFCFPIGISTVTCSATNACGSNTCTFIVNVRPAPYPVLHCPSNIIVTTCGNGAVVNYPPPYVPSGTSNVTVFCTPPSGSFFPLGTNLVRCCALDRCQRTNCCEFLIIVRESGPCVKPPAGMVLWLPLDEPVGVTAANIIPGAPNGGHINGPVPLIGQYVLNSLGFDGSDDFVRVPNYAAIVLSGSDLSIDAWVRPATAEEGRRVIVSKLGEVAGAVGPHGYEYYLNNGVINLLLAGVAAQNFNSGVAVPADGNWHHLAVTVQRGGNGQVTFYLDGAVASAQAGPIALPLGNNNSLFVGAGTFRGPNSFFRGHIDEVEIFNRALHPAEVFALWNAHHAGKCKITCAAPMNVPVQPGTCVTVNARICNNSAVPQTVTYVAEGPAIATVQTDSFTLLPFTCTNIPVTLSSPETTAANAVLSWTLSVSSDTQCPMVCTGSVINPGIIVTGPNDPTGIPGTNTGVLRVSLGGLPAGSPVRLTVMDPDMEMDMQYVSLNGLPPGTPWTLDGILIGMNAKSARKSMEGLDIPVRFTDADPGGLYTILLEADLDGDGTFETLSSFAAENSVVPPPTIRIVTGTLQWDDMGDGLGTLESADSLEGPWTPVPGGPGTLLDASGGMMKFYRVAIPVAE